jgi:hypothetical protein
MAMLREHEGDNAPLLKELKTALAAAAKISPDKADKSIMTPLKAYKELADQIAAIQEKTLADEDDDDEGDSAANDTGGDDEE